MPAPETDTLATIRHRIHALVEARLQGLSADEQREYQRLIEREAALLKQRERTNGDPGPG